MADKDRSRRYRQRQRDNLTVVRVPVRLFEVVDAMIMAGLLREGDAADRAKIEAVLGRLIAMWHRKFSDTRDAYASTARGTQRHG